MIHTKKWFLTRRKKRIFRDDNKCGCLGCKEVLENGLVIHDEQHAEYLLMEQNDRANDKIFVNYRDRK